VSGLSLGLLIANMSFPHLSRVSAMTEVLYSHRHNLQKSKLPLILLTQQSLPVCQWGVGFVSRSVSSRWSGQRTSAVKTSARIAFEPVRSWPFTTTKAIGTTKLQTVHMWVYCFTCRNETLWNGSVCHYGWNRPVIQEDWRTEPTYKGLALSLSLLINIFS